MTSPSLSTQAAAYATQKRVQQYSHIMFLWPIERDIASSHLVFHIAPVTKMNSEIS